VQSGELHGRARELDGVEVGERHHVPGAAHVPHDRAQGRGGGHGRELPGDRPARLATHHPEAALQLKVVHLHHRAVDLVVEAVAALLPIQARARHRVDVLVRLHTGGHTEPVVAQPVEHLVLALELEPLGGADPVAPHRERPRGGQLGVELAEGSGGGVARVRERGLAGFGAALVERREGRQRQVDLAADLEQRRSILDPQRDRSDRAEVLGHVLADRAVAPRGPPHEDPVLVDQGDGQAVDLGLGHVVDRRLLDALLGQQPPRAGLPLAQLLLGAGVGQREHGQQVAHGREALERAPAHPLRGGVRRAQRGVRGLEAAQLVQQAVVLGVGDLGVVEDVVAVVVVLERTAQLGGALEDLGRDGGAHASRAGGASRRSRSNRSNPSMPARSVRSKCSGVTAISPSATAAKSVPAPSS